MEKFFDDPNSITEAEILSALRKATIDMKIVPMVCGSSFKNKGVQTMLDLVMELLPSPLDKDDIVAIGLDSEEPVAIRPDEKEPFAGLAFKIATDPFVGRLCFVRAYSGILESGSYIFNSRSGNKERISRVFQMHANKQNQIERLVAGDIGAVVGFKDIKTGDTLCDEKRKIVLESMVFPEPVIGYAIEPKKQVDADRLGMAISKLVEEDPTLVVNTDQETGLSYVAWVNFTLRLSSIALEENSKLKSTKVRLRLLTKKLFLPPLSIRKFTRSRQVVKVNLRIFYLSLDLKLLMLNPERLSQDWILSTESWVVLFQGNSSLLSKKVLTRL